MSTYSTNLALELIGTGEQAGTWGNTTNTNLGTLIEQAISGYVTQAVSTGTDTTITIPNGATGVARNMFIELTGTGGTNTNLIVPANKKLYFIYNNASGAVTVKVSGQTGVSVAAGAKVILVSNGTDIVTATSYLTSGGDVTFSSLTLSGGTANGVLYLNASKVVTSGTALVFDASNVRLGIGTASPAAPVHVSKSVVSGEVNFLTENTVSSQYGSANFAAKNDTGVTALFGIQNSARITYGVMTASSAGAYTANAAGLYFLVDAAGSIRFATNGGTECARVASGGQFLIGTTSTVSEEVLSAAGSTAGWRIGSNRTAVLGSGNAAGGFNYSGGNASSATAGVVYARAEAEVSSATASSESGALVLLTRNSGTLGERARITSTGNLLVGTTTDVTGLSGVISDIAGNVRNVPSAGTTKTSAYTLAITDIGEFVTVGTSGSIVVPNDVFAAGNAVSLFNNTSGTITVSLSITTAYIAGTEGDKNSVTLAARGLATLLFISPSLCIVTGNVS